MNMDRTKADKDTPMRVAIFGCLLDLLNHMAARTLTCSWLVAELDISMYIRIGELHEKY